MSIISLSDYGFKLRAMESMDAYELYDSMYTVDAGRLYIRHLIEGHIFVAWGENHIRNYLTILLDDMKNKLFIEAYQTHGQGD